MDKKNVKFIFLLLKIDAFDFERNLVGMQI